IEEMPLKELKEMQYKSLKTLVYRLYSFSDFYRKRMRETNVHPDDIRALEDVIKLPFMVKSDLRDNYPDKLFVIPRDEVVRYHASSGTTGKPTVVGYTQQDLEYWTSSLARGLTSCGLGRGDVIQVSYGYGLFTGGLGLHYGAEKIGAAVLPTSVGNTERQIELMQDMEVTAIACTPSYLIHIGEAAEKMGISIKDDTHLKTAILGAEPWSNKMRLRLEEWLGIKAYDIYGTSELSGPLFTECEEQDGIHVWADMTLVEIIDPETGEQVAPGERGELTITMLRKEALPIVRYRVGDVTHLREEVCGCGRTHPRIGRIEGRVDDMLIIRGINVFPSQIEHTLMSIPQLGREFQIVVDRKGALDELLVRVELGKDSFSDKINDLMDIKRMVAHRLRSALNISVEVELADPGSLPRFEGKAKRVVDRREL
ncbi:MAG TPA: phenylacetate--CoA ligase, partial [Methanomassiliicoccales archaeon]|nr:phenylacetate--CoA ligase [Methanomassiliicoccales archaeon]